MEYLMNHEEAEFQARVIGLCAGRDLWPVVVNPERFSQRTADNKGYPDLMIIGPGGVLFRELKTEAGMRPGAGLRPDQTTWRYRLTAAGQDWAIWTPKDLATGLIESELHDLETPDDCTDVWALSQARARGGGQSQSPAKSVKLTAQIARFAGRARRGPLIRRLGSGIGVTAPSVTGVVGIRGYRVTGLQDNGEGGQWASQQMSASLGRRAPCSNALGAVTAGR
jgi:hypothetical protein